MPPKSENGVVSRTGSGFHDGPSTVERSRCRISRPQMIHAHGSYVGAEGTRNESAVSPRTASATGWRTATRGSASAGSDGRETVSSWAGGMEAWRMVADDMLPAVKPCQARANTARALVRRTGTGRTAATAVAIGRSMVAVHRPTAPFGAKFLPLSER